MRGWVHEGVGWMCEGGRHAGLCVQCGTAGSQCTVVMGISRP